MSLPKSYKAKAYRVCGTCRHVVDNHSFGFHCQLTSKRPDKRGAIVLASEDERALAKWDEEHEVDEYGGCEEHED